MDDDVLLVDTKGLIRSVLILFRNSSTSLKEFLNEYKDMNGDELPFRRFGYRSSRDMLSSLTDTVTLRGDTVTAVATEVSGHISKMVNEQKEATSKRNWGGCRRGLGRHRGRASHGFGSIPTYRRPAATGSGSTSNYRPRYGAPSARINPSASGAAKSSKPPESITSSSKRIRIEDWVEETAKSASLKSPRPSDSTIPSAVLTSTPQECSKSSLDCKPSEKSESTTCNSSAKPANGKTETTTATSTSKSFGPPDKSTSATKPPFLMQNILPVPLIKVPGVDKYVPAFCVKEESKKDDPSPVSRPPADVPVAAEKTTATTTTTTTTTERVTAANRPWVTSTTTAEDSLSNGLRECHVSDAVTSSPKTTSAATVAENIPRATAHAQYQDAFGKLAPIPFSPITFMPMTPLLQETNLKIRQLVASHPNGLTLSAFNEAFFQCFRSLISPNVFGFSNLLQFLSTLPFITMINIGCETMIYPNNHLSPVHLCHLQQQQQQLLSLAQTQHFMPPLQGYPAPSRFFGGHVFQAMPSYGVCRPPPGFIAVRPHPPPKSISNGRFEYERQHRAPPGFPSNAPAGFSSTSETRTVVIDVDAQTRKTQEVSHVSAPFSSAVIHEVLIEDAPPEEEGEEEIRDVESPFPDSVSQSGNATSNSSSKSRYRRSKVNDDMKLVFRQILCDKRMGFLLSDLHEEYKRISGQRLDVSETGFHSLLELVGSIPDVFKMKRTSDTSDWILFSPHMDDRDIAEADFGSVGGVLEKAVDRNDQIDSPSRVLSAVPPLSHRIELSDAVRRRIIDVLQLFTNGLVLDKFPSAYQLITDEEFEFDESTGTDLFAIFHSMSDCLSINRTDDGTIHINLLNSAERASRNPKPTPALRRSVGPRDVVEKYAQFRIESGYENKLDGSFFPVLIEGVTHPGKFSIRLWETNSALTELMDDLKTFYSSPVAKAYAMPHSYAAIGRVCVALYENDGWLCRATIIGVEDESSVTVRYVDFGSAAILNIKYVYLIKQEFMKLPSQAICSQLHACFPVNEQGYPLAAVRYFRELVDSKLLYAMICDPKVCRMDEEQQRLSLRLVDTTVGDEDVHIREMLVRNGFAILKNNRTDVQVPPVPLPRSMNMNTESMISPDADTVTSSNITLENGGRHIFDSVCDRMCCEDLQGSTSSYRLMSHSVMGNILHTVFMEGENYIPTFEVSKLLWGGWDILRQQVMVAKIRMSFCFINEADDADIFARLQTLRSNVEVQYNSGDITAQSSTGSRIVLLPLNKVPDIIAVFSTELNQFELKEKVFRELIHKLKS